MISLTDTTTSEIAKAILQARRDAGSTTQGRVLTLIVVTDHNSCEQALAATKVAAREHPSRVLIVTTDPEAADSGLDAQILTGDDSSHEVIQLQLRGHQAEHPTPVLLALLVPDAPVVTWWPQGQPVNPAVDPIGQLATRRITDSGAADNPITALRARAATATIGDTDLAWTRLSLWRALLAAALDQFHRPVHRVVVSAVASNASSLLLAAWLGSRLDVPVDVVDSDGPGITEVALCTDRGDIRITRADARHARYHIPDQPARRVALPRRSIDELLTEELRRLDHDEVFADTVAIIDAGGPHDR